MCMLLLSIAVGVEFVLRWSVLEIRGGRAGVFVCGRSMYVAFFFYMAVGEWGCNKEKRCAETETGGLGATGAGWGQ